MESLIQDATRNVGNAGESANPAALLPDAEPAGQASEEKPTDALGFYLPSGPPGWIIFLSQLFVFEFMSLG